MAEINTVIAEASQDLQTIEDFVNLPAGSDVRPRLLPSVNVGTLAGARQAIFESGGLPATPFATKALMTASALIDGKYAIVTNDAVLTNNGYYEKVGGAWVYSKFNVQGAVAELIMKSKGELSLSDYTAIQAFVSDTNLWVLSNQAFTGIIVPVQEGATYRIIGSDIAQGTRLYQMKKGVVADDGGVRPEDLVKMAAGSTKDITIKKGRNFLWFSSRIDNGTLRAALPKSVMLTDNNYLPTVVLDSLNADIAIADSKAGGALKLSNTANDFLEPYISTENEFKEIVFDKVVGNASIARAKVSVAATYPELDTVKIMLTSGDVLDFEYYPHIATILAQVAVVGDTERVLLKENGDDNNRVKSHKFTAYKDGYYEITGALLPTIKVNNIVVTPDDYIFRPSISSVTPVAYAGASAEWADYVVTNNNAEYSLGKGDTIRVTNVGKNHVPIAHKSTTSDTAYFAAYAVSVDNSINTVEWTAIADTKVRLSGTTASKFLVKKAVDFKSAVTDALSESKTLSELTKIQLPPLEYVFATYQNYILKMETVATVEKIAISTDLGKTWSYINNVVGDVTQCHFFTDGTIMICSPTKVYWTDDYVTLNESTILDFDGSPFVPTSWHFFGQQNSYKPMFVEGQELFAWGEYVQKNDNPRFWYTTDYGRTIKCGAKFGVSILAGDVQTIKHVHTVAQHAKTERFYMTTGDFNVQCKLLSGTYDFATDVWDWTLHGQGDNYKFGAVYFDDYYLYTLTDYTETSLQNSRGLLRAPLSKLDDINAFKLIYKAEFSEYGKGSPFKLIQDNNGYKVITPELYAPGFIWVAKDDNSFKKLAISSNVTLSYVLGANYNGDIYVVPNTSTELHLNEFLKLNRGSYNLTRAIRGSGLTGFMRNRSMYSHEQDIV